MVMTTIEINRRFREAHPDYYRDHRKVWREANLERCREVDRKWQKQYRGTHPEEVRISSHKCRFNLKIELLSHYSKGEPKCAYCGDDRLACLSINHINGGGSVHKRDIKSNIYVWLKNQGYPKGYQVLCMNCQQIKKNENHECVRPRLSIGEAEVQRSERSYQKIQVEVFSHYSEGDPRCTICGNIDLRVLSIDHINGGGYAHLKEIGIHGGTNFYLWLKKQGYPSGYQVLCMNCQWRKRHTNNEYSKN